MPKPKLDVVTIFPGGDIELRKLPVEDYGALVDAKKGQSVLLTAPPARYRLGKRIVPWERVSPIRAHFADDGEDLNFQAGPMNDWREIPEQVNRDDEDETLQAFNTFAEQHLFDIGETDSEQTLMRVAERLNKESTSTQMMITMALLSVAIFIIFASVVFVNNAGGIGNVIDIGVKPTPTVETAS